VVEYVSAKLGAAVDRGRGANTYACSVGWSSGAQLAWTPERAEGWLSLNSDSLALMGEPSGVLTDLASFGAACTRVDVAADDATGKLLDLDEIERAAGAGNVQGFRRCDPRAPVANVKTGELEGRGIYFGRRGRDGSGRFVRFYDKGLESKGAVPGVRFEVEFSGEMARMVSETLIDTTPERFLAKAGRLLAGAIDFRERGTHRHHARMAVLPWWDAVLQELGQCVLTIRRVVPALQRACSYLRQAWRRNLAKLAASVDAAGQDGRAFVVELVGRMMDEGRERNQAAGWSPGALELCIDRQQLLSGA
jgi:hypothetical protein